MTYACWLSKIALQPWSHSAPIKINDCCRLGMMCAVLAAWGRSCIVAIGKFAVCVDLMIAPFGILTLTPISATLMLAWTLSRVTKWPVAPVSRTKVRDGEGDILNAEWLKFSLHCLLLSPSHNRQLPPGLPNWLLPLLSSRVASSLCPGFLLRQLPLLWSGCTRYPCVQQYPPRSCRGCRCFFGFVASFNSLMSHFSW